MQHTFVFYYELFSEVWSVMYLSLSCKNKDSNVTENSRRFIQKGPTIYLWSRMKIHNFRKLLVKDVAIRNIKPLLTWWEFTEQTILPQTLPPKSGVHLLYNPKPHRWFGLDSCFSILLPSSCHPRKLSSQCSIFTRNQPRRWRSSKWFR